MSLYYFTFGFMFNQTFIDELSDMFRSLSPEIRDCTDLCYQMNTTTHAFVSALYRKSPQETRPVTSWLGIRFHIDDKMADGTVILAPLSHTASRLVFLEKVYPWRDLQLPHGGASGDLDQGKYAAAPDHISDTKNSGAIAPTGKGDLFFEVLRKEWHQLDRIWDRLETSAKRNFLLKWSDHNLMDAKERCIIDERYEDAALLSSLIEERLFCL